MRRLISVPSVALFAALSAALSAAPSAAHHALGRRHGLVVSALLSALVMTGCANLPAPARDDESTASRAVPTTPGTMAPGVPPVQPVSPEPPPAVEPLPASPWLQPAPRTRLDPDQDAERASLWDRIRNGWALNDLPVERMDARVGKWEQFYARQPDYVQRMVQRGSRYLFHIVEEVERRNLPAELALLPFIESAFNPQARSSASASGMWQFMPATGMDFELRQNLFRDDRRDVLASTRAALDYLQRLHRLFGDWHLALAAYNWGQGNVNRAIERNRREGLATDYASLRMPEETRDYVPKLLAVKNIVVAPHRLGLQLPPLENHPFFLTVPIERDIDVAVAARLAGMSLEDFQDLNPQMNQPVILAAGVPQILLPYDNANRFVREVALARGPLATWTAWVAPRTLQPEEAARLVGMPEAQLRSVNRIPARMWVAAGSTLLVPRGADSVQDVSEHLADNAMMKLATATRPGRRVSFKAGRQGDNVAAVARRYQLGVAEVARWNGVDLQARFNPGQAIVVVLPATASSKARPVRATTPGRAAPSTAAARAAARKAAVGKAQSSQSVAKPKGRVKSQPR